MNPHIWQTVFEPEERVADIEAKTQAHEAAAVVAILSTASNKPFNERYQAAIRDTEAATTQAIREYVHYRRTKGQEPLNGDDRVMDCRKILIRTDKTLRQCQRQDTLMRNPIQTAKCTECGSTDTAWHCTQTNRTGVVEGRLRTHDVHTEFFLACLECSETLRTVKGDDVAQWLTDRMQKQDSQDVAARST